ncbi:HK97-gp10 family putative phage morphogenesis protein [Pelagibacterium sp. H642]|uniref:HK97-gp10 family putative phage morphogenesis protein n=1 Tax=Pelagibacterium sp. H642 TaxID=1881069 RepID=UPI00281563B4|nr:HK97-gp10 family putative phage morphogenesis protein [Pelagibacterium sp. H642]WMT90987.1 HK97 gp10 family phage protein [Pelagibacterium sp. H642]
MAIRMQIMGRDRLMKRLRLFVKDLDAELRKVKLEAMKEVAAKIASRAPSDTGFYRDSIEAGFVDDNPQAKTRPGYRKSKDPDEVAIYGEFIWRFLEYGTAEHVNGGLFAGTIHPGTEPQPHVMPTWRANRDTVKKKVRKVVNRLVRESNAGRRR